MVTTPSVEAGPSRQPGGKLHGWDFYKSIGSPKFVVAPMVDQSELAWRVLSRSPLPPNLRRNPEDAAEGGAHICYTPMINARHFSEGPGTTKYTEANFNEAEGEEGSHDVLARYGVSDRPLIVQFCANDPEQLLKAAKKVEGRCDAVDINLGCPQHIAKRGRYGSFLQDEWDLIGKMIETLHKNLAIPVTAKFRMFPDVARTIEYAKMMEAAGASILTIHGRTREMKGHKTGLADWDQIKAVKQALKIPLFANGNILYREDVDRCIAYTGCDGVMTAEGNLSNPGIFLPADHPNAYPPAHILATRYLDIVDSLRTPTGPSAVKAHLFRLLHHIMANKVELRSRLGRAGGRKMEECREIVEEARRLTEDDIAAKPITEFPPPSDPQTKLKSLPYWAIQPYVRPILTDNTRDSDAKATTNGDAMTDSAEHGTGEERVAADSQPDTPMPAVTVSSCTMCADAAAQKCPRGACVVHCRAMGKMEADPACTKEEAIRLACAGGLGGLGCEAHEAKANARKQRQADKRQHKLNAIIAKKKKRAGSPLAKGGSDDEAAVKRARVAAEPVPAT